MLLCLCGSGPQTPPRRASSTSDQVSWDEALDRQRSVRDSDPSALHTSLSKSPFTWSLPLFTWNRCAAGRLSVPRELTHRGCPVGTRSGPAGSQPSSRPNTGGEEAGEGRRHQPPSPRGWPQSWRPLPPASGQLAGETCEPAGTRATPRRPPPWGKAARSSTRAFGASAPEPPVQARVALLGVPWPRVRQPGHRRGPCGKLPVATSSVCQVRLSPSRRPHLATSHMAVS